MKGNTWDLVFILLLGFLSAVFVDLMWENLTFLNSRETANVGLQEGIQIELDRSAINYTDSLRNNRCNHFNCFNVYKCDSNSKLSVFVYPERTYVDKNGSQIGIELST